ncbi:hypothetical protein KVR01_006030 [Diaporthe batatas]|uniref:uncharacterized protein n=1 Tax=Diaporthe batatas TaxID=748121 RepID=UPI001D0427B7|nr:uncharacterized protein KVR01_006030 [Diaporthe batatas]KAG8164112.1 hypothetical protein KVR01_006030 [Diaporthe batatas]
MSSSRAQPPPGVDPTKFAQRAIGRTPEEHAALERVLAARRRRRGDGNGARARSRSPEPGPSRERADLAQQRRDLERRERLLAQQREDLRIRRLEQEHELRQRRVRQEQQLAEQERRIAAQAHAQAQAQAQQVADDGLSEDDAERQHLLSLSVAQRRTALLTPFGFTGTRRRAKGKSKGSGWHKRGYRDSGGYMWINVKIGEENTQGQDVWEGETLAGFVSHVSSMREDSDYGFQARNGTMDWDLLFRKKSLRKLLVSLEEAGLEDSDVLVRDLFDGGETVYYRLYNGDGDYVKHVW